MKENLAVVGQRLPRWGAHDKATGAARFVADIKLPGMLVGKVLYSPHAHARIVEIDTSRAEQLQGVEAVITWADVPKILYNPNKLNLTLHDPGRELKDMYVLSDKARFVGDRIASVAAVDAAVADAAIELIQVQYDVLPSVFDPLESMSPGAPQVHDRVQNNVPLRFAFSGAWGDTVQGFKEADMVLEDIFWTSRQHIFQMEPCACVAAFAPDGRLTIWSPSQHVFLHRRKIAELFDLHEGMIRWITPHVGGGFGKYGSLSLEPVCVALAKKAGRPVKIEYSREEDMFGTETRQTYVITGRIGLKKDGTLTAMQENLIVDGGAYFTHNASTTGVAMGSFTGLYRCPHVAAEATCVYTNFPPTGGVRGYGDSESTCVLEQLMDKAALRLGLDPLELRLKNIKKTGDRGSTGLPMESCTLEACLKLGADKIGWKEKRSRPKGDGPNKYGIGLAIMMDVSGGHPRSNQDRNAFIKFNEDGSINLIVSGCDMGQNLMGTMAQVAAEVLGLHYEEVHIVTGDTDCTMFDTGQHASGGCYQIGQAVIRAAEEAKKQLLERAAVMLDTDADNLEAREGWVTVKSDSARSVSIPAIAKGAMYNFEGKHLNISGKGTFSPTLNPPPFAAVFTEVEVDTETGVVKVIKILYVADSGRAINPATVEGQIEGGIAQSIGYCLTENYVLNRTTGGLMSENLTTYKLPSTLDMPEIEVVLYETPIASGPFGAKGVGHSTMIAVTPAIANAIYDAVGVFVTDMPATPEKIFQALKGAKRQ